MASSKIPLNHALARMAASIILLLGGVVLFGWHARIPAVIQIHPDFVPMQYNTALGFLLAGIGLLAVRQRRRLLARVAGGLVGLIGITALIEHLSGANLGVDQLFMAHYITVGTSHPGRMAPNTALCFTLAGITLLMTSLERRGVGYRGMIVLIATLIVGLGATALIGYVAGVQTAYGWGNLTRMAVHTALGFMLLGGGLIALLWERAGREWLGWIAGLLSITISIALWRALAASSEGPANDLMLVFGLAMSLALIHAIRDAQRAHELNRDFVALLENTTDFIYFKDKDSRFRFCSQTLADITGHTHWRDMIGKHDLEVFPKDTAQVYYEEELPIFRDGVPLLSKVDPYYDGAGKPGWVSTNKWPILDEAGKVVGLFGISRDITERRQAELSLRERMKELQALYSLSELVQRAGITAKELCAEYAIILPKGWQYPEIACARFVIGDSEFRAENFAESPWMLSAPIVANGEAVGRVELAYLEERPAMDEGPFLKEERQLLDAVAERVGHIVERRQAEDALRESEERFRVTQEVSPDGFTILRPVRNAQRHVIDFTWVYENATIARLNGTDPKTVVGQRLLELFPAHAETQFLKAYKQVAETGERCVFEDKYVGEAITTPIWFRIVVVPTGKDIAIFAQDITERKQAEEALRKSEALFHNYFELGQVGMAITSIEKGWLNVNARLCEMLGYTRDELTQMTWTGLTHPDDLGPDLVQFGRLRSGEIERYEMDKRFIHKRGNIIHTYLTVTCQRNPDKSIEYVIASLQDISERKRLEEEIRQMAFYDPLTSLPNRRLMEDRLNQVMTGSKRSGLHGALMFIDLDNFKPLNDAHGHGVGDLLLIEVADRLRSCVREVDTVARFGGDEFVVMLSELDVDKAESTFQAETVAEKIRAAISEPYRLTIRREGKADATVEHCCSASIGVALFIDHEATRDEVLQWADMAMYKAKVAGRNFVLFHNPKD